MKIFEQDHIVKRFPFSSLGNNESASASRKLEIPREHFMQMGSIKDRNGLDLTEAEDIKKRWQEYTGELYKTDLHDPKNHDGVITHLEPDNLEFEVKWAIGKHHYEQS